MHSEKMVVSIISVLNFVCFSVTCTPSDMKEANQTGTIRPNVCLWYRPNVYARTWPDGQFFKVIFFLSTTGKWPAQNEVTQANSAQVKSRQKL